MSRKSVLGHKNQTSLSKSSIYKAAVLIIKTLKKGGDMIADNGTIMQTR